jgi:hypothetical protein
LNKKSLVITSSIIAAISLSACNANNNANKHGMTNTSFENVGYQNKNVSPYPGNPYPNTQYYKNVTYTNDMNRNVGVNYGNGNDRINEGLKSEYINDGMIKDAHGRKGVGRYYTNNTLNPQNVRYNPTPNNTLNTQNVRNNPTPNNTAVPIVPYTNINTNPTGNYDGKLSDLISAKVAKMSNVADVRTMAVGNQILIAVDLKNHNVNENIARDQVKKFVAPMTVGKKVYVSFDPSVRNKIKDFTDRIKSNNVVPNATKDINDMFRNVGNKVKNITK